MAAVFYTLLIVTLNLTAQGGGTALAMPGEDVFAFTPEEVKIREKGAKIDLVAEQVGRRRLVRVTSLLTTERPC